MAVGLDDPKPLMSDNQFAELLKAEGVEPGKKTSPTTGELAWAFAKNDSFMKRMVNHRNPRVKKLIEARLAFKSTQEYTRVERFLDLHVAAIRDPDLWNQSGVVMNVPLLYYGAHTGRFSGLDKLNLQNLGRGSRLREALVAPSPDEAVVAADFSQIEARITACVCGQDDLVEEFRAGEDVYSNFATDIYGYKVNADDHPAERFVGKTGILSLGYQSGAGKYHTTMVNVYNVDMTEDAARDVVNTYRNKYKMIRKAWYDLQEYILAMSLGNEKDWGPVTFIKDAVVLPNGMYIHYRDCTALDYHNGKHRVDIYGGKLLENIVQALARIVMTTAELRLARAGLRAALSVHDELVYVVKRENVTMIKEVIKQVMEFTVPWLPNLPVACEIKHGSNYLECK